MKTIKELTVTVTYRVSINDLEVPDNVYGGLCLIYDNGGHVSDGTILYAREDEVKDAYDYLAENIKEDDGFDFEYELLDMQDDENY